MKEKREQGSPPQLRVNRTPKGLLAAEVGDEPEQERERDAEEQTGDDGKVKRGVFAAVDDVAGQFSQPEWKLIAEVEKSADKNEESSKEHKGPAKIAERIHKVILPEAANESFKQAAPITTYHF